MDHFLIFVFFCPVNIVLSTFLCLSIILTFLIHSFKVLFYMLLLLLYCHQ